MTATPESWTSADIRHIVEQEVENDVLAYPLPSWESLVGDNHEGVVAKTHAAAAGVVDLKEGQTNVIDKLDALADVVLGEERKTFDGTVVRDGGLQKLVTDSQNGGVPIKLSSTVTAALITAMAGIFGTLLILIFQHV